MLVDRVELERQVREVYRAVARDPLAPRHFETGRGLALRLGYPESLLAPSQRRQSRRSPASATTSTSRGLSPATACSISAPARNRRILCRHPRRRHRSRGRRRLHRRPGRDGREPGRASRHRQRALRGGEHRRPAVRRRQLRRRHLQRRHQPLSRQASRLRRGRPRAASGRTPCDLRHRQRPRSRKPPAATRNSGQPASQVRSRPRPTWTSSPQQASSITAKRRNAYRFLSDRAREACQTYGVASTTIAATRETAS